MSRNAYTGGKWIEDRRLMKELNAMLREQKRAVESLF